MPTVTCKQCGNSFDKPRNWIERTGSDYCSTDCYHADTRNGRLVECPTCGKKTYKSNGQINQGRRFCSRSCYESSRKAKMVTKVCYTCGKEFTVKASIAHRYTVCNWECRCTSLGTYTCERCGEEFASSESRWKPKYCSETCYRPPHYINCRNCGDKFRVQPADEDRQFCSFSCYRRFNGETLPERSVRRTLDAMGIEYIPEAQMGRYSVDFLLTEEKIALEVDGVYWHQNKARDRRKDKFLRNRGYHVCRVTDKEIEDATHLDRFLSDRFQEVSGVELTPLQPSLL